MLSRLASASARTVRAGAARGALPTASRLLSGLSDIPAPNKSATEEALAASRRLQQFNESIDKDLSKVEKAMAYSLEKNRLAKYVAVLEERGFSVENHPDSHSVFLKKTADSGEHIVIDFWEDEEENQVSIVIEISKDSSSSSSPPAVPYNMYFKCVGEDDLLGLQALELAPPALLEAGDRGGIYGYPFDRDVSDEMKYYMTKHLHTFGVNSDIAKFANFFIAEKRKYAKVKLLLQTKHFLNDLPGGLEGGADECAELYDPLGLLRD